MKENDLNHPSRVVYENYVKEEDDLKDTICFVLRALWTPTERIRQRIISQISGDYNSAVDNLCGGYGEYVLAKILRSTPVQFEEIADAILEHKAVQKALQDEKRKAMTLIENLENIK